MSNNTFISFSLKLLIDVLFIDLTPLFIYFLIICSYFCFFTEKKNLSGSGEERKGEWHTLDPILKFRLRAHPPTHNNILTKQHQQLNILSKEAQ